ncbi:branched-chain amino acid aminotransferase [Aerococcaceae bacterium NML191292]|nr:branched-chain amino acid aminotransferase [Aerococcaceae bacterium NML210727]MCW6654541.1 branched-chain amino acid aminotransferase [Aerococcaceae bacterium NML201296]MCW6659162.1 branched-chain amino acid aminotransferase [Aerococcaceae bacterium NML191292]MCW6661214.1 branched-chain amino acid aminotransferase [Aerococcaceae bacterium NML201209]MCW6662492.1 branched-chain amino acid aminotransferase [Aerococcaceae bacterium NML190073]MCW6665972.1 branched-chain amino acid aminotransfera
MQTPETINWNELGFGYIDTGKRFRAYYKDGQWSKGGIETDRHLRISEASNVLHYGQTCFEGLKAYRTKSGEIQLFRPDENAKRMRRSAERLLMAPYPEEDFVRAVHEVVRANADWVPPYGSGASLYIRPLLIGVGDGIGVAPASEYIFTIFVTPVGAYFKKGLAPANFLISDYDRAAPKGTGAAKVAGNYAASLYPGKLAKSQGYTDAIYLDPATKTKIEEVGAANFFGITKDGVFLTPKSPSILPSITKYSLLELAEKRLGLKVKEGDVYVDQLDQFAEAGACGTAAVITPIGSITVGDTKHVFFSETEVGPTIQRLYRELTGIQYGDLPAPDGWIQKVDLP